jgi:hypothetical protein
MTTVRELTLDMLVKLVGQRSDANTKEENEVGHVRVSCWNIIPIYLGMYSKPRRGLARAHFTEGSLSLAVNDPGCM